MDECAPQELQFDIYGMQFSAQTWGNSRHPPILALHGWLDNSASFFALAPQLKNNFIVALDMAGHGKTSHRPGNFPYNIWEDVSEIFAVADYFGWNTFSLLGHSRGAIIATIASGTFPERIESLGLIEGILPEPVSVEDVPLQLAASIKGIKSQFEKSLSIYPDIAIAIKARERGMFPLGYEAAKALTERGLKKIDLGHHWSTDQRLLIPSAIKLLPEQMAAFISRIQCPITLVLAENGMVKIFPAYIETVEDFKKISVTILPGGHHLHMQEGANAVASVLNPFFARRN